MNDDKRIIREVLAGEREAYAELVRLYHVKVITLCLSLLGNPTQAEDAAQDVFLKAYRNLSRFRQESAFSTWIYRIAYNHCLNLLRARKRNPSEPLEAMTETQGEAGVKEGAPSAVEDVLSRLPPDYREVLTLREVQGLTYAEIAQAMECSLDSVKARLRRARQALQNAARASRLTP
ncbi:MAG: sigma-70 family RNA polymerase sigma factor [Elusimicrobia bacterium]|nr:sigma-70 family RNA polymerase sigma factor [Elusimicrobiota bacterium]